MKKKKKEREKGIIKTNKTTTDEFFPMIIKSLNYERSNVSPRGSLLDHITSIDRLPEFPFFLSRQWRVKPGYKGTSPLYIKLPVPKANQIQRFISSERKDTRYIPRFSRNETAANKIQGTKTFPRPLSALYRTCCLVTKRVTRAAKIFYGTSTRNIDAR